MKIKNLIYSAITGALLFTQACKPDEYSLDAADISSSELAEGIAFEIVHDASNYNLVHLKSLVDSKYQCIWETPQGRFQNATVDLKMPFEGKYPIVFGVETRGGIVYSDTAWFDIKEFYAEFVSDPLWKLISGGAGESKTWYLDIDEEGVSRYWTGPVCYYGLDNSWETEMEGKKPTGTDVWSWFPDYKGNTWIVSELKNFGSMTFDLNGGAHLTIKDADGNVTASGVYSIDAEKHTMTTSDATIIHCNFDDIVLKWGNIKIIKADENSMQLAVVRDNSSEGECLLAFSYISEDYYNNWTLGETEEKPNEPQLPENWKQDISEVTITTTSIKWTLSDKNPLDWANLDGSLMNGWKAPEDYPDWLGTPNYDDYKDFSMTLNSADNTVKFVTPDGTETSGTYSIDDKGIFTFEGVSVPSFTVVGWASFAADANGQLRILSIEKDDDNVVTGMWLGARSTEKEEYMAYHLVCSAGANNAQSNPFPQGKYYLNEIPEGYYSSGYGNTWESGEVYVNAMVGWWKFGNPDDENIVENYKYAYNAYTSQYIEVKENTIIVHAVWPTSNDKTDNTGNPVLDAEGNPEKESNYSGYKVTSQTINYTIEGKVVTLDSPISLYTPFGDTFQDKFTTWNVLGKVYTPDIDAYKNCALQLGFEDEGAMRVTFWRTTQAEDIYETRSAVPTE